MTTEIPSSWTHSLLHHYLHLINLLDLANSFYPAYKSHLETIYPTTTNKPNNPTHPAQITMCDGQPLDKQNPIHRRQVYAMTYTNLITKMIEGRKQEFEVKYGKWIASFVSVLGTVAQGREDEGIGALVALREYKDVIVGLDLEAVELREKLVGRIKESGEWIGNFLDWVGDSVRRAQFLILCEEVESMG